MTSDVSVSSVIFIERICLHVIFSLELSSQDSLCVVYCLVVKINISPPPAWHSLSIASFVRGLVSSSEVRRYIMVVSGGGRVVPAGWQVAELAVSVLSPVSSLQVQGQVNTQPSPRHLDWSSG